MGLAYGEGARRVHLQAGSAHIAVAYRAMRRCHFGAMSIFAARGRGCRTGVGFSDRPDDRKNHLGARQI